LDPVTYTDNCDAGTLMPATVTLTHGLHIPFTEIAAGCANPFTGKYTWTATDKCGNKNSESIIPTVDDTEGPTIVDPPGDQGFKCKSGLDAYKVPKVTFHDTFDGETVVDATAGYPTTLAISLGASIISPRNILGLRWISAATQQYLTPLPPRSLISRLLP
jgi:hypothetical protein